MTNQIQNFLNYLLDSETTSEISFIETIKKNQELFQIRHLKDWEDTVFCKLQQLLRNTTISSVNNGDYSIKSENESSDDQSTSSSSSEDEDEENNQEQKPTQTEPVNIFILIK